MEKNENLENFIRALQEKYPTAPLALNFSTGFELLVAVILSAQCSDQRVNSVTGPLFKKYKKPQDYLNVPPAELENDIRPTGFYRNKAKSLRNCCAKLIADFNGKLPGNINEMTRLPGVGRKTAAMVLGNALGSEQGIAVDTHVKRVLNRLEISRESNPDKIEKEMMARLSGEKWTWFSNATILFGREICRARTPGCPECPNSEWCPFPDKTV